jgi:hypothetical protein
MSRCILSGCYRSRVLNNEVQEGSHTLLDLALPTGFFPRKAKRKGQTAVAPLDWYVGYVHN